MSGLADPKFPYVSVIVPVYNDLAGLNNCLFVLTSQTYPRDRYEIMVVDNGSEENVRMITQCYPQVRLVFEPVRGSYAARNQGIRHSYGEILAFTDSDCMPAANWIERGVEQLGAVPNCGLVGGRIGLVFRDPQRPTAAELYDRFFYFHQDAYVRDKHFAATANLFTSRRVFEKIGLFDDGLQSGGDREWGRRVYAAGYAQVYAEDVTVFHRARSHWADIRGKFVRINSANPGFKKENIFKFIGRCVIFLPNLAFFLFQMAGSREIVSWRQKIKLMFFSLALEGVRVAMRARLQFSRPQSPNRHPDAREANRRIGPEDFKKNRHALRDNPPMP
ncbi:MAG: glycosyltransferase, partial [Candidatus Omnitrophica bacterium]|nr:glycosyltransferase [Candidatus Omnitrophota bacterium]